MSGEPSRSMKYQRLDQTDDPDLVGQTSENSHVVHFDASERALGLGLGDPRRPKIYYNEGPFDAPSSEEDLDDIEVYGEKQLDEEGGLLIGKDASSRRSPLRYLLICLGSLVLLAVAIGLFAARSYRGGGSFSVTTLGTKKITMDHVFNGTFAAQGRVLRWVPEAGDGVFSIEENGYIKLVDLKSDTTKNLVRKSDVRDNSNRQLTWDDWKISPDMRFLLVKSASVKQWRHSSYANYFIHDLNINFTRPIAPITYSPVIAHASFSPTSPTSVVFVSSNDIYILKLPALNDPAIRITNSGSKTVFNGVPDWVYEEEVLSGDKAFWFSPDSRYVAYLSFDESFVKEYTFPIYNPGWNSSAINPYTGFTTMKYPKPGFANPIASLHVFDTENTHDGPAVLNWEDRRPLLDSIIMEVAWVSNQSLVIKEVDRSAVAGSVSHFDLSHGLTSHSARGKTVRTLGRDGENGDEGWIDSRQVIYPLKSGGYLDIIPSPEGYDHIALFDSPDASDPKWVTSGKWEVTDGIHGVDEEQGKVYFTAANPSSVERHIYSASLPDSSSATGVITPLTDTSTPSYYSASFSPETRFYALNYEGPNVPTSRVLSVQNTSFEYVLTENKDLNATVSTFIRPSVVRGTMTNEGYELNTIEIRPPNFDGSGRTKYPVFFQVYGGPGAQLVNTRYGMDWHYYLASSLKYVVVRVDGRGTGFKGRKLRNIVKGNLGHYEVLDQIAAARLWASKPYVDKSRIGIWGWSYGGYMTNKIAEAGAGIHKLAISVAPVTDWRLYDSIYTERYMGVPAQNEAGYNSAAVGNVTAFDEIDFALAHGSGDDNVHFANTAHLLDLFTASHVRRYRFRMFTDSDHSIATRGAYRELHEWLTAFLIEKWGHGVLRNEWKY